MTNTTHKDIYKNECFKNEDNKWRRLIEKILDI